ncbi:MAG: hypothetical protein ABI792_00735 [bacterium]
MSKIFYINVFNLIRIETGNVLNFKTTRLRNNGVRNFSLKAQERFTD